jgi:putative PIN family toxin of toxin-antitoxin system
VQGVTLDTNVYVSALEFGGIGSRLIGLARAGLIRMDVSDAILDELITVLRDDFHWDRYRMKFARLELARLGNLVVPKMILNVTVDPDDNRILECAVEAGSDFLVTSDNHLLRLRRYQDIKMVRPVDFLQRGLQR